MKQSIKIYHSIAALGVAIIILQSVVQGVFNVWTLSDLLLATLVFYVHALVLVPLLFKPKAVNRYVLFTFGLFAISSVGSAILSIASRSDYMYIFTKILYHGPAFGNELEQMYRENFFQFLMLFALSLVYGLLVLKQNVDFKHLANTLTEKKYAAFLIHILLLIVITITSYFAGVLLNPLLLACTVLFYIQLMLVAPFWIRKKPVAFITSVLAEMLAFNGLFYSLTLTYNALAVSLSISIIALATIYAIAKQKLTEKEVLSSKMVEIIVFNGLVYLFSFGALPTSLSISILTIAIIYAIAKQQFTEKEALFSKKEMELQQLKSQINPHFLFNTMNTLYSFALKENAERTASNIKKLSNLIRFMLGDIEKDYIPLQNEVGYIKDYIDIQLARCSSKQNIAFNINNIDDINIAPMLLFPFVENSFKHGINPGEESTLILNLCGKANSLQFECRNSLNQNSTDTSMEQGFGIGITNVKSRLDIIYPNKHTLEITKTKDEFLVNLEIYDNSNCN